MDMRMNFSIAFFAALAGLGVAAVAAWVTHIIIAISVLTTGAAVSVAYGILLAVGVFFPPVGMIHGLGYWLGVW